MTRSFWWAMLRYEPRRIADWEPPVATSKRGRSAPSMSRPAAES